MLGTLRKNANSNWVKATFVAIVIVFIFWGVGGVVGTDEMQVVARVNDEVISSQEFEREYQQISRNLQDQNQGQLPAEFIRKQVLDQLITRRLLGQEANRLGLMTGDDELRQSIASIPAFQVDGRFNREQYVGTLRANGFKPSDFEDAQRQDLLMAKVEEVIRSGAQVSDTEIKERFVHDNERVNLSFVKIESADFIGSVSAADEEIEQEYKNNQEAYREPAKIKIQYLRFQPDKYGAAIQPADTEIQAYYDSHIGQFRQGEDAEPQPLETVRDTVIAALRQQRGRDEAMRRAEAAHERLLDGESLQAVATAEGMEIQSPPPFSREEGIPGLGRTPDLVQEVFAVEPGDTGELLTTADGYAVFTSTERIDSTIPELAAVRDKVATAVRERKAQAAAKERAEALRKQLESNRDVAAVAKSENLTVDESGPIVRVGGYIAGVGNVPTLKEAAFQLTSEAPLAPGVYETNGDWIVAALKERLPADETEFDKQKTALVEQARRRAEMIVTQQFMTYLRGKAQIEIGQGYSATN